MRALRNKPSRLGLGLENEEVTVVATPESGVDLPAEGAVVAEVPDNANSLETDLLEVAQAEAEVDQDDADLDNAMDTAAALEELAVVLTGAQQQGGLDRNGAAVMGLYLKRIGVAPSAVSMESFGGTSSRQGATVIAVEDFKSRAKEIYTKVIEAIEKGIQYIIDLWNKYFGAAEKQLKRAEKLMEVASRAGGDKKESKITNERLAKAIAVKGDVAADASASKLLLDVITNVQVGSKKLIADLPGALAKLDAYVDGKGPQADAAEAIGDAMQGAAKSYLEGETGTSKELPGGKVIFLDWKLEKESISIAAGVKDGTAATAKDVPVLSIEESGTAAKHVADLAKLLLEQRGLVKQIGDFKKKLVASGKKAISKADESKEDTAKNGANMIMTIARGVDQPYGAASGYAINTAKALLDQVELSLKQYEIKKAEGEKAAEKKPEGEAAGAAA